MTDLSIFNNSWYNPGAGFIKRLIWYFLNAFIFSSWFCPVSSFKVIVLKLFGAKIGKNVVIKPRVNIKYPWHLEIGDHTWVGESVWLDSLGKIKIGNNVCISQGAYICTGNHDWSDPAFGLFVKQVIVEDGVWIGARTTVLPGVILNPHSIVTSGAVISKSTEAYGIYSGNPAVEIKKRVIK